MVHGLVWHEINMVNISFPQSRSRAPGYAEGSAWLAAALAQAELGYSAETCRGGVKRLR